LKISQSPQNHPRDTSLFSGTGRGTISNQVRISHGFSFVSVPGQKPGKVKPKRQRGAMVAIGESRGVHPGLLRQ